MKVRKCDNWVWLKSHPEKQMILKIAKAQLDDPTTTLV